MKSISLIKISLLALIVSTAVTLFALSSYLDRASCESSVSSSDSELREGIATSDCGNNFDDSIGILLPVTTATTVVLLSATILVYIKKC